MRRTGAGVFIIVVTCFGVRAVGQVRSNTTNRPSARLVPLINDNLVGWTVEKGPKDAVTVLNGTLTVTEQAGLVRGSAPCTRGAFLTFDVRTASSDGRGTLVLGVKGPTIPVRGYALPFPSGSTPLHEYSGLDVLKINPASIAKMRKPPTDWAHYEIRCDPDYLMVAVDDNRIVDERRPGIAEGWFGVRADVSSVMVRNLRMGGSSGIQSWPELRFDTKGVEFGPWTRRFIAQIRSNWLVPFITDPTMSTGHVVLTFNVHKDGSITDVTVAVPCPTEGYNGAARSALTALSRTQPLPTDYPDERAFFTITFHYNEVPQAIAP